MNGLVTRVTLLSYALNLAIKQEQDNLIQYFKNC